ncbi:ATP-binding protein, partial [Shewanella sp. MBTL60-007]|uniref:ATP-binding protein n=1 Tax=Shewanella sp. MBTL60-007 TaxID=2815911 RepID=UPI001C80D06C
MKIKKVEIEGFRAYKFKKDATFDFTTDDQVPSNFIAIYAPNGFGKSSFYDAVEWAFTANLERYVTDHNRKNNELAARCTKQAGIAQCILRNKDVPDEIQTTVSVQTTQKQYTRTLPKTKTNSRDLKFNKNETEKGTEFFQHIILSQDAIDRFLREVKPQERYNIFMEHFGGENEGLRQEITALLNDNKNILLSLRKQRDELSDQLIEPIDETIFSEF